MKFLTDEGAVAWLEPAPHDGGTMTVMTGGSRDPKAAPVLPRVAVDVEHYGRIFRTLEKNIPVTLRINIANKFYDDNPDSFNIIAEIPGTDKADEVVMLGAHFDSWASGTGATDNAAGSAVVMEAHAHSESVQRENAAHGAPRAVDRRGRGTPRVARLRQGTFRRSRYNGPQARSREAFGLFQRG